MELVTGVLAKEHSGFDEFVFIAETGKIAFYTESLCLVIEVSFNGGMGKMCIRDSPIPSA